MDFRKLAESCYGDYVTDLDKLVSIESVRDNEHAGPGMPFGPAVARALDEMLALGKENGFATHNYEGYAGTISMGEGEECVGILGHLDVVPLGEGWSKNPLGVTEADGYLYGRGVLDDKGPTLAAFFAMKIVKELNIELKRKVMLIVGCDEESGMECMKYYEKHGQIPELGFTPDAEFPVIYGEKGNIHMALDSDAPTVIRSFEAGSRPNIVIENAHAIVDSTIADEKLFAFYLASHGLSGSMSRKEDGVHLHIKGKSAHGSMPYNGTNAGVHLLNYIACAYDDALARDLHELLHDWKGTPENIDMQGLYMGFLTMNPGIITIKDGHAHALVDIRYPNDTTPKAVEQGFIDACKALETPIVPTMEYAGDPLFVDPNSQLVRDLMASYAKYSGDTFHPAFTIGGGTYAKKFKNFVAFGPEKSWEKVPQNVIVGGCHQPDEAISKNAIIEAIAIYADAIVRLANQ